MTGDTPALNLLVLRLEEMLMDSMDTLEAKRLLVHDIAQDNNAPKHKSKDGCVRQRDPRHQMDGSTEFSHRRWMTVLRLPEGWDTDKGVAVMIGPKRRGVSEMRGDTECDVVVNQASFWSFVFVSGKSIEEVRECAKRARDRVKWAESRHDL